MTKLSPAAKAVMDAAKEAYWLWDAMCPAEAEAIAAAALRAAADQVVPEPPAHWRDEWLSELRLGKWTAIHEARTSLLAIATELEAPPNNSEGAF